MTVVIDLPVMTCSVRISTNHDRFKWLMSSLSQNRTIMKKVTIGSMVPNFR